MKHTPHLLFGFYVQQILELFQKAISQPRPAVFLSQSNARTLLFDAEGLVRLVNRLISDKEVKRTLKTLKKLEDALGKISECNEQLAVFSGNKKIKPVQSELLSLKRDSLIAKLDVRLIEKAYYQNVFNDILFEFAIDFNDELLIKKLREIIRNELEKAVAFYMDHKDGFKSHKDVHELRRKLRWISIYAQAFRGIARLKDTGETYKWEKEFITKKETMSPFNKLKTKKDLATHIDFNKKAFLALSYMINELGQIKDALLLLKQVKKTLLKAGLAKGDVQKQALLELGAKEDEKALLNRANVLAASFFEKHRVHEMLIL
jgi:hypothetical protein